MVGDVMPPSLSLEITDEECASASDVRVLITAPSSDVAEALARRLHFASARAAYAIVQTGAAALPDDPDLLREWCSSLVDQCAGGTLLISDVEQMLPAVQQVVIQVFDEVALDRPVRFMFTTTVPLHQRIGAGFSERLFYRLNTIHLRAE